jgi:hypothetical protein
MDFWGLWKSIRKVEEKMREGRGGSAFFGVDLVLEVG